MNNHPFTLKKHTLCSFERLVAFNTLERCNAPTDHTTYCTEHVYAQRLLDLAAERGYPEMQPVHSLNGEKVGLLLLPCRGSWQAYAERVSEEQAEEMIARLKKIKPVRKAS